MELRTCDHLKEDGVYCNSPALKGRNYCYFHLNIRGRRHNMARSRALGPEQPLNVPFPEDMHAVQVTIFEVVTALLHKRINTKDAGIVLYGMQQAATNLLQTPDWHGRCPRPEPNQPLLALEFPAFEEQYQLPKGIDLEADPETALQEAGGVAHHCLPPAIVGSHEQTPPLAVAVHQKKRRHHRRAARVPLPVPKQLWQHNNPDAPFRAYTSDGRELTRADAQRWHKRMMEELAAFAMYGDKNVPVNLDEPLINYDKEIA